MKVSLPSLSIAALFVPKKIPIIQAHYQALCQYSRELKKRGSCTLLIIHPDLDWCCMTALWILQTTACQNFNAPCGTCDACTTFIQGNSVHHFFYDGDTTPLQKDDLSFKNTWKHIAKEPQGIVLHGIHKASHATLPAILKALEEPPPQTFFILTAPHEKTLPPTILSRCQIFTAPIVYKNVFFEMFPLYCTDTPPQLTLEDLYKISGGNFKMARLIVNTLRAEHKTSKKMSLLVARKHILTLLLSQGQTDFLLHPWNETIEYWASHSTLYEIFLFWSEQLLASIMGILHQNPQDFQAFIDTAYVTDAEYQKIASSHLQEIKEDLVIKWIKLLDFLRCNQNVALHQTQVITNFFAIGYRV